MFWRIAVWWALGLKADSSSILVFIAPKCFWNDPAEILGACSLLAQSAAGRRATTVNEVNEIRRNTELFRAAYQRKESGTGTDSEQRERDDASEQKREHAELARAKQRAMEQGHARLEEQLGDEEVETGRLVRYLCPLRHRKRDSS